MHGFTSKLCLLTATASTIIMVQLLIGNIIRPLHMIIVKSSINCRTFVHWRQYLK